MKILVVSESFIIRDSLNHILNEILDTDDIITVSNLNNVLDKELLEIDFSFIDVNKNNINIVKRLSKIRRKFKSSKIMILDSKKDIELFIKSVDYGIDGYILNIDDKDEFIYIIKKVLNGKKFYDSELLQYTIHNEKTNNEIDLTNREKCVLNYV